MKHVLLLTLLCLFAACHDINSTSTDPNERNLAFDNSVYLSIAHLEDQSILRRKLLNFALADQIKKPVESETSKIKEGDEFNFANNSFKSSSINQEEYKKLKSNAAEVIVSFSDRVEIYFVPIGIMRDKAFSQLGLIAEPEASFLWVESPDKILLKDKVYYLLSASKVNLQQNDVHFNQQKISLGDNFNEKMLSFAKNQILELEVKVDYLEKETNLSVLGGPNIRCTSASQEAGICGPCTYKLEAPTGRFINRALENSELVDLDIIINGKKYHFSEFNPVKDSKGNFKVTLDLKKLIDTDMASIQIYQNTQYPVFKNVQAQEILPACIHKNVSNTIDITPSVKMNIELNVLGRVLNFSI